MSASGWIVAVMVPVLLLAAADVYLLVRYGVQATISRHTIAILARYPIVAVLLGVAVGVLLGHLAWPQPTPGLCP